MPQQAPGSFSLFDAEAEDANDATSFFSQSVAPKTKGEGLVIPDPPRPEQPDEDLPLPRLGRAGAVAPATSTEKAWQAWQADPSPESNHRMLNYLQPTIERAARTYVGNHGELSPLYLGRARALALDAMRTYRPAAGASLETHLFNHMRGLQRYKARVGAGVRIPERLSLDRRRLDQTQQELSLELGREPSDDELADRAGMSLKRIASIRRVQPAVSAGRLDAMRESGQADVNPSVNLPGGSGGQPEEDPFVRVIYDDLSEVDKVILASTLGMFGRQKLSNNDIARKLRRSPGFVSQRKNFIQRKLDDPERYNPFHVG